MKRKIYLLVLSVTAGFMSACTFLDPLPNGSYNDENFELYPELLRGFVDVVYNELLPETYLDNYYIPMSCARRCYLQFSDGSMAHILFRFGKNVVESFRY